eukprot:SM000097S24755  [mRNA]  locus=s97:75053:81040:- [translate_table: standard]
MPATGGGAVPAPSQQSPPTPASSAVGLLLQLGAPAGPRARRLQAYRRLLIWLRGNGEACAPCDEGADELLRALNILISDINLQDGELSTAAMKALGFFVSCSTYAPKVSVEVAQMILTTVADTINSSAAPDLRLLGLWLMSHQRLPGAAVRPLLQQLVATSVQILDDPQGSGALSFEAMKAIDALAVQEREVMTNISCLWVPALVRQLLHDKQKWREQAAKVLRRTRHFLLPASAALSQAVVEDVVRRRLIDTLVHVARSDAVIPSLHAWAWLVQLSGGLLTDKRMLINNFLKLPEISFTAASAEVRQATLQVAWKVLITSLLPAESISAPNAIAVSLGTVATANEAGLTQAPSCNVPSKKRVALLVMPLVSIMCCEKVELIRSSCVQLWVLLMHRLSRWANSTAPLFSTAALPMLDLILEKGPRAVGSSLWAFSCILFWHSMTLLSEAGSTAYDPCSIWWQFLGKSRPVTSLPLQPWPFKWKPWTLLDLDATLNLVNKLMLHGFSINEMHSRTASTIKSTNTIVSERSSSTLGHCDLPPCCLSIVLLWTKVVKCVEGFYGGAVQPSTEHVAAVHTLIRFTGRRLAIVEKNMQEVATSLVLEADGGGIEKDIDLAWQLAGVLLESVQPLTLASSLYNIKSANICDNDVLLDRSSAATMVKRAPSDVQDILQCCHIVDLAPTAYICTLWSRLAFSTPMSQRHVDRHLKKLKELLVVCTLRLHDALHILGAYSRQQGGRFGCCRHLPADRSCLFDASGTQLHCTEACRLRQSLLLEVWKVLAEHLCRRIEQENDQAMCSGQPRLTWQALTDFLLYPMLMCRGGGASICSSVELPDQILAVSISWNKLFIIVNQVALTIGSHPNAFIGFLSYRLSELNFVGCSSDKSPSPSSIYLLADIVAHIAAEIDLCISPTQLHLKRSRKRRQMTGSLLGQASGPFLIRYCSKETGDDLKDFNYISGHLHIAGRLLDSLRHLCRTSKTDVQVQLMQIVTRVMAPLAPLGNRILTQNDALIFLKSTGSSITRWLSSDIQAMRLGCNQALLQLDVLLNALFSCLRRCRPQLAYDFLLLQALAPLLTAAILHNDKRISNHGLAFWNDTFGARASNGRLQYAVREFPGGSKQGVTSMRCMYASAVHPQPKFPASPIT